MRARARPSHAAAVRIRALPFPPSTHPSPPTRPSPARTQHTHTHAPNTQHPPPGFLAKVFEVFRQNKISVDVVATSEVSVSLTLDPKKLTDETEEEQLSEQFKFEFNKIAQVSYRKGLAILSLICNTQRTSEILQRVFSVLAAERINVQRMSQGASKTNISLVVDASEGTRAIQALHREFFER